MAGWSSNKGTVERVVVPLGEKWPAAKALKPNSPRKNTLFLKVFSGTLVGMFDALFIQLNLKFTESTESSHQTPGNPAVM
jgi:hypothetical protein